MDVACMGDPRLQPFGPPALPFRFDCGRTPDRNEILWTISWFPAIVRANYFDTEPLQMAIMRAYF